MIMNEFYLGIKRWINVEEDGTSEFESVTKLLNKIELLGKSICV